VLDDEAAKGTMGQSVGGKAEEERSNISVPEARLSSASSTRGARGVSRCRLFTFNCHLQEHFLDKKESPRQTVTFFGAYPSFFHPFSGSRPKAVCTEFYIDLR
jgi:hypothetical protein